MLVDAKLVQFSVLIQYQSTPQTSNDVQVVDERLVKTKTKGNVNVEEIKMRYLTKSHTTHRCRDNIVNSWRVFLAKEFLHQRTTQCIRCRLPEIHTVRTGHIEV